MKGERWESRLRGRGGKRIPGSRVAIALIRLGGQEKSTVLRKTCKKKGQGGAVALDEIELQDRRNSKSSKGRPQERQGGRKKNYGIRKKENA